MPKQIPVKPSGSWASSWSVDLLQPLRAAPDPSIQIYEKDVILEDTSDVRNNPRAQESSALNKRVHTEEQIEREELSDEDL